MTGPFVPVGILNPIRAVVGIHNQRFNLFVKRSSADINVNLKIGKAVKFSARIYHVPGGRPFDSHRITEQPRRKCGSPGRSEPKCRGNERDPHRDRCETCTPESRAEISLLRACLPALL